MASSKTNKNEAQVSNGASDQVAMSQPYIARVTIAGVVPLLLHAWNTESVAEKAAATKNSKAKKTDDVESYVYRDTDGKLGIAGKCLMGAIAGAAKFFQDPRSSRKSAHDIFKAGVQVLTPVAPFLNETETWDYEDKQRVVIMR